VYPRGDVYKEGVGEGGQSRASVEEAQEAVCIKRASAGEADLSATGAVRQQLTMTTLLVLMSE
jgi:hypothetical protein